MPKSEKLFWMLEYVKKYPHVTIRDLSRLCDVSERGIYRYINTLSRAGILVRFQEGGYVLPDRLELLKEADVEVLRSVRTLLSMGMRDCDDAELLGYGKDFVELVDNYLPETRRGAPNEIEVIPEDMESSHHGGIVTIGHSSKPSIINPILTSDTISVSLMALIFSSLVKFDNTLSPVPDLAKDWEVSEDGLEWTFFIRDDVKFHDGHLLTAHDVEFTYRAIMDPKNTSPMAKRYQLIDEVRTEGDYIFRITLKHPSAILIHWLGEPIAPKHLLENVDLYDTTFNRRPVGSGPFKLADWTKDDTIVLDANSEYFHRGRPILDRLIFKTYLDRKAALQAITQGEMDIALDLAASDLFFASRGGVLGIYPVLETSYYALVFNLENPMFSDIKVRQALDYAVDRESIIKNQLKKYSKICTGPFSVSSWGYNPDVQPTPHNIGKAKELLGQAGWRDTNGDGILDRDGKPFEIALTVPNISDSLERLARAIEAQLIKVGIRVKLVYVNDSELHKTPLQAVLARIPTSSEPDSAYRFWHSKGGDANLASYENKSVDDLLELGRRTMHMEKRKAIYHKIHKIIHDDCPAIFLASGCDFIGSNYRFRDIGFSSTLHFFTTMKDWQIISGEGRI